MKLKIAYTHHKGLVSRHQHDALWIADTGFQSPNILPTELVFEGESVLLALADGVSSSAYPSWASRTALQALYDEYSQWILQSSQHIIGSQQIRTVQQKLASAASAKQRDSATSIVAAHLNANGCRVLNVGDSRAYRISNADVWEQLSRDHTILQDMIEEGQAQAWVEYASMYNGLMHCLVANVEAETFSVAARTITLESGDSLLLTSDGVHDVLRGQLQKLWNPNLSGIEQVSVWREAVLEKGAWDNYSMILVRCE